MKKLMFAAIFLLSQFALSAGPGRIEVDAARKSIRDSRTYQEIETARREAEKNGKFDVANDAVLRDKIASVVDAMVGDPSVIERVSMDKLVKLVNLDSVEMLAQIMHESAIIKDKASTPEQVAIAKKTIQLIAKSAHTVNSLVKNSAEATAQIAKIGEIAKISNKIASLEFGQASKTFVEKYETELTNGKSVEEAIKLASNGKFTEKELRECE